MKIISLFDNGTAEEIEDQHAVNFPFIGVADGVSETFYPDKPARSFNGLTGGQYATDLFSEAVLSAVPGNGALEIAQKANRKIYDVWKKRRLNLKDSSEMPGACFVLIKLEKDFLEIAQCGDSMALWVDTGGRFHATPNQVYAHDLEMLSFVKKLMGKYKGNRGGMWNDFGPNFLAPARRKRVNKNSKNGYGLLNGQPEAPGFWFHEKIKRPVSMLLCTDGFLEYKKSDDKKYLGNILTMVSKSGLELPLGYVRKSESRDKSVKHIDFAEATAVYLEF